MEYGKDIKLFAISIENEICNYLKFLFFNPIRAGGG